MPSLTRDGGPAAAMPKYQRIAAALRRELERAAHTPGGRLPSERTLAARYQVNRQTVRAALQHLREDGLIVTERRGTRSAAVETVGGGSPTRPAVVRDQSRLTLVSVPPSLAELLGMRGGDRTLVHHRRERGPSGETLRDAVTYVCPGAVAGDPELARYRDRPEAAVRDEDLGPLHRWLERAAEQGRVAETLTMTRSSRPAAAVPVCGLTVRRTLYDDRGRLLAVTDLAFPTWNRLTFHRDHAVAGFHVT
ncbi:GntR family transcriptional regulator [Streptomyces sp. NBC_01006]|uniref:GntR family transcriptional regulator n=1 Tax=Streptomyces sp. NBC_01006 TaxID=2903716 RepID=UPI00386E2592|nr:GntR family transcriptional regulator [Streptomyces sp. NBC_01006]